MKFPVFSSNGEVSESEIGSDTSTLSGMTFPQADAPSLPRYHDDREAELAEARSRVTLLMNGVSPEKIRALDRQNDKQQQLRRWESLVSELSAACITARNAMLTTPPDFPEVRSERSDALRALEAQFNEAKEEASAAAEELSAASAAVLAYAGVTA
jgi:hypothetical protein